MHLDIIGRGPPLVLIHGWAMHGGVFAPLLDRLGAHFECHVVDLPGHGLSEERDGLALDATVERLLALLPPAIWLGWSLGGLFALEAAARAPERVRVGRPRGRSGSETTTGHCRRRRGRRGSRPPAPEPEPSGGARRGCAPEPA